MKLPFGNPEGQFCFIIFDQHLFNNKENKSLIFVPFVPWWLICFFFFSSASFREVYFFPQKNGRFRNGTQRILIFPVFGGNSNYSLLLVSAKNRNRIFCLYPRVIPIAGLPGVIII